MLWPLLVSRFIKRNVCRHICKMKVGCITRLHELFFHISFSAPLIDKMVTVSEEWIAIAILRLVEMEKAVVEGGGASGVAAVLAGLVPELAGKK